MFRLEVLTWRRGGAHPGARVRSLDFARDDKLFARGCHPERSRRASHGPSGCRGRGGLWGRSPHEKQHTSRAAPRHLRSNPQDPRAAPRSHSDLRSISSARSQIPCEFREIRTQLSLPHRKCRTALSPFGGDPRRIDRTPGPFECAGPSCPASARLFLGAGVHIARADVHFERAELPYERAELPYERAARHNPGADMHLRGAVPPRGRDVRHFDGADRNFDRIRSALRILPLGTIVGRTGACSGQYRPEEVTYGTSLGPIGTSIDQHGTTKVPSGSIEGNLGSSNVQLGTIVGRTCPYVGPFRSRRDVRSHFDGAGRLFEVHLGSIVGRTGTCVGPYGPDEGKYSTSIGPVGTSMGQLVTSKERIPAQRKSRSAQRSSRAAQSR